MLTIQLLTFFFFSLNIRITTTLHSMTQHFHKPLVTLLSQIKLSTLSEVTFVIFQRNL